MHLSDSAHRVLHVITTTTHHDYPTLMRETGKARGTIAAALRELKAAGLIDTQRRFGAPATYTPIRPFVHSSIRPFVHSSSSHAMHENENENEKREITPPDLSKNEQTDILDAHTATATEPISQPTTPLAQRIEYLLTEWRILGKNRERLRDALLSLLERQPSTTVFRDLAAIHVHSQKRGIKNPSGLRYTLAREYAETGQLALW